jgi:hypothetical protein
MWLYDFSIDDDYEEDDDVNENARWAMTREIGVHCYGTKRCDPRPESVR